MVDLFCTPFVDLVDRMRLEYRNQQSMFDLPARKWYLPADDPLAPDLSVRLHDKVAGTPVGPASGPQTQMAQNLVLSWLAGGRLMELKTVQVNDRLTIPRPCIDAANVGYNVEWSQELSVPDSLDQYVQGAMLIHMLRHAPEVFGNPFGELDFRGTLGEVVFDMSVGYDLAGIQSDKVCRFIRGMIDATDSVERLRNQIPHRLHALRELDYPTALSRSITLSTFHGCPADEIERICEFLLAELDVHVIVKMNPPMLGKAQLAGLLHDQMGYTEVTVRPEAYTSGLQFDEAVAMCGRLTGLAESHGLHFGAKFSNTLEVLNHRDFFPADQQVMYLSGPPLHVITLTLADEFRQTMGPKFPISFSAGVDRKNFANMVTCGFVPVTTCTDLLKTGGYGRLPPYLHELVSEMRKIGARTVDDYILDCHGQRDAAGDDPVQAGFLNTSLVAQATQADERYHASRNQATPRKIGSHLVLFDCVTCDKCVPVCPNDANFTYPTPEIDRTYRDVEVQPDGSVQPVGDERRFRIERQEQIANFADYCNHCGNCDTFCPEYDGPYIMKPSFFGSRAAFAAGAPHDGFLVEGRPETLSMTGRLDGRLVRIEKLPQNAGHRYDDGTVVLRVGSDRSITLDMESPRPAAAHRVDIGQLYALLTLLAGISSPRRVHAVNTPLVATEESAGDA